MNSTIIECQNIKEIPNDYPEVISSLDPDAPIKNDSEKLRKVLGALFASDIVIH